MTQCCETRWATVAAALCPIRTGHLSPRARIGESPARPPIGVTGAKP
ncbi:hypothetical protein [Celeribacter halophilus]|nr:hypothetical protein [Celeribacter halophilus]